MTLRALLASAAILPLGLFAAPAHAVLPSGNVIVNGNAETGPGAINTGEVATPPGWTAVPNFTQVQYGGSAGFPTTMDSAAISGGNNFFAGGPDGPFGDGTFASQRVDLSGAAPEIDSGNVQATLSAQLGGFASQADEALVTISFADNANNGTQALFLQTVTPQDRGNVTGFRLRTSCVTLPPSTRLADVLVTAIRRSGAGTYNDGYADNVSLTLSTAPCPAGGTQELPPPVENPQPRVNANAQPTRGRVLVKQPGSDNFVELEDARSIPIGSEIDATKGAIQLETAANTSGASQTGEFYDGAFVVTQTAGSRPTTDLRVTGRIDKCPGTGKEDVRAAARRRGLWGNTRRGRYRTRGRYATATVRGTIWQTSDTCNTTTVKVRQGTVIVRDLAKRKNIRLKAPRRYTARRRSR